MNDFCTFKLPIEDFWQYSNMRSINAILKKKPNNVKPIHNYQTNIKYLIFFQRQRRMFSMINCRQSFVIRIFLVSFLYFSSYLLVIRQNLAGGLTASGKCFSTKYLLPLSSLKFLVVVVVGFVFLLQKVGDKFHGSGPFEQELKFSS